MKRGIRSSSTSRSGKRRRTESDVLMEEQNGRADEDGVFVVSTSSSGDDDDEDVQKFGFIRTIVTRRKRKREDQDQLGNGHDEEKRVRTDTDLERALELSKAQVDADLRRQQDEEYQLSVALDRSKQEKELEIERRRTDLINTLEAEPGPDDRDGIVTVRLDVPSGRWTRRFSRSSLLNQLFVWIEIQDKRCFMKNYKVYAPPLGGETDQIVLYQKDMAKRRSTTMGESGLDRSCVRVVMLE